MLYQHGRLLYLMISTTKIILLVVIIAVAGGAYYWNKAGNAPWQSQATEYGTGTEATEVSDTLVTGSDASNKALDEDLATIETQLDAFNSDNASVEAGLADQPVEQSAL